MNRIDRLTAIIIFLQGRKFVTVDELSERYSLSTRTVYRDLAALQEAGVPIGNEPQKGYFIVKGYHLPPVMLNRNEAAALLAGERMMQKWNHTNISKAFLSALEKIRSVLPSEDREYVEILDKSIQALYEHNEHRPQTDDQIFLWMQNAIFQKEVIKICYESPYKQEKITRQVEPLGLLLKENHWYLAAWCRLRQDYRMFRLDRFHEFTFSGEKLGDPPAHSLKEFHQHTMDNEKELTEITIWFDEKVVRYIGDSKYHHGWAGEEMVVGGLNITFLTAHPEYLSRWILLWGKDARVLQPEGVRNRVKELAEELYTHYQ